jgi:hypothetical protein
MMQLNQDSRIAMMAALLSPALPILPGSTSPFRYFAERSRPFAGILKGIRWEGLFGAREGSNDPVARKSKRLAYEIKQSLGIKGFVLNLAGSSALANGLPACWDAIRPCLETPELEDATAQILSETSRLAEDLGDTNHKPLLRLSHDEAAQLQVGLDFYRFLLPKMLVLTSALRLACDQELIKRGAVEEGRAQEKTAVREDGLHGLFHNIRRILAITPGQGAVTMPRAWSKYLAAASAQLKPLVQGENFHRASAQLHKISRQLAPGFQERINTVELDSLEGIAKQVARFETLLPPLIISITLLELYLRPADRLLFARPSPSKAIPAARREVAPKRHVALQPVMDLPTRHAVSSLADPYPFPLGSLAPHQTQ